MYPSHMPRPLPSPSELLVAVLTLVPIDLVQLQVLCEVLLSLETPSALTNSAEEGTSEMHLPMHSHGLVMDRLLST